jgi:hypothetical protein
VPLAKIVTSCRRAPLAGPLPDTGSANRLIYQQKYFYMHWHGSRFYSFRQRVKRHEQGDKN